MAVLNGIALVSHVVTRWRYTMPVLLSRCSITLVCIRTLTVKTQTVDFCCLKLSYSAVSSTMSIVRGRHEFGARHCTLHNSYVTNFARVFTSVEKKSTATPQRLGCFDARDIASVYLIAEASAAEDVDRRVTVSKVRASVSYS